MKKYILLLIILLISCQAKIPFKLGKGYYLDYDRNSYYTVFKDNQYVVPGEILDINYNSTYIIVVTRPIDKIRKLINPKRDLNFQQQEKLINGSRILEYWIINKDMTPQLVSSESGYSMSNAFGPFDKNEFEKNRHELKIPVGLKLLSVEQLVEK